MERNFKLLLINYLVEDEILPNTEEIIDQCHKLFEKTDQEQQDLQDLLNSDDLSDDEKEALGKKDLYAKVIPGIEKYVLDIPLTLPFLSRIKSLTLDGGNWIYGAITYYWDGEDDLFDINSVAGIEACKNLEEFVAISMLGQIDLRPFSALKKLQKLDFDCGTLLNFEALLEIPSLQEVIIGNYCTVAGDEDKIDQVIEDLEAKGVTVEFKGEIIQKAQ